jgi:hypothetical protein
MRPRKDYNEEQEDDAYDELIGEYDREGEDEDEE